MITLMWHFVAVILAWNAVVTESFAQAWDDPVWPGEKWDTVTPEEQGIDSERLAQALEMIREKKLPIHSLTLIRHGRMALDVAFWPYDGVSPHDMASATKSVTSALVGAAIDREYIDGVGKPVFACFPRRGAANLDSRKLALTVEHLLTMRNGLHGSEPKEDTLLRMAASPDWIQFMLDLPLVDEPGKGFAYSSGGVHLLSGVVRESTGRTAGDFARSVLFGPLGMGDAVWAADPRGNQYGWGDLRLHPHDMARFGLLYLRGGEWRGREVLSLEWVEASTRSRVALPPNASGMERGYGYLWWVFPGFFSASGRGGQLIAVWPEKDMVIVTTGGGFDPGELLLHYIAPAVKDAPLPPAPQARQKLISLVAAAKAAPGRESAPAVPSTAREISGIRYVLEPNWAQWKEFSLTFFDSGQAVLFVNWHGGPVAYTVGTDDAWRTGPGRYGIPAAAKGEWRSDSRFELTLNEAGNINFWRIGFEFSDRSVQIEAVESTGLPGIGVRGERDR